MEILLVQIHTLYGFQRIEYQKKLFFTYQGLIKVRGERHEDKIRFKGKDVERVFQMENLRQDVQLKHTEYIEGEDYEFLLVQNRIRF